MSEPTVSLQDRVRPWLLKCFGERIANDRIERNHRFLEEALELVQAAGCSRSEALQLVAYVYGRSVGEVTQEVGGVMITLAALCLASGLDMHEAGEIELRRIWAKIDQIREKQAGKPRNSPLPTASMTEPNELSAEEIAQEFNRREWKGRKDWRYASTGNESMNYFYFPSVIPQYDHSIGLYDARALLVGWRAQEELAALKAATICCPAHGNVKPTCCQKCFTQVWADSATQRRQIAALTAEVERGRGDDVRLATDLIAANAEVERLIAHFEAKAANSLQMNCETDAAEFQFVADLIRGAKP